MLEKQIDELSETMIIFLSARSEDYTQISAYDAGADDYISKPIKPKILLKKISNIAKKIKKPPIIVFVEGISFIPSHGSQTQNIPPITSVKDSKVKSAAGICLDPIE